MDQSDFQGDLEAIIAGTRREFWSPNNLKIYGDERPPGNSCGASGGAEKGHSSSGRGPPSDSSGKFPTHFSNQSVDVDVGSKSAQEMQVLEATSATSSMDESEHRTPMTELDLLVQKYDRRLKQLHPAGKQTESRKRRDIAKEKSRKYKCEACGKGFDRKSDLNEHVLIHGEERKFACDICDKSFKQPRGLSSHMRIHDLKLSYECHVCDYSSKRKSALDEHARLHSEEAEFKCETCPKAYKQSGALKQHRLTHTFDVPFRCEICDCGFKTKDRLKQHRNVHQDIRKFKCEVCIKAFKSSSDLKIHSVIHSTDKRFPCDKCSKAFHRKCTLKVHERTHTGEKPFICCDCTKAFTQSSDLNRHRRICPKLDFRVKDLPEEDFSPANGNLIETFASTIYPETDEGNSKFVTMEEEGAGDCLPEPEDLDGTYTGRVIQAARSSYCT